MQAPIELWAALVIAIVAMLLIDFRVFGRGREAVTVREAAVWSLAWLGVALAFGALLWMWRGGQASSEYLAGYLLERSLSLDNIFVFAVIFTYFAVPVAIQPRVLSWGIALALVLRLVFILIGAALLASFHVTYYLFGALLLYTAWKLFHHDGAEIEPDKNPALGLLRRYVPMTSGYHGGRLTVRAAGRRLATPLVAVFVVVATTDVVFAIDSIPAIFAITRDPYIVFAANAFAMVGLRALYFLLVGAMDRFAYLSYGLAAILAFIGAKMLLIDVWHPPFWVSLVVIVAVLALTAILSLRAAPRRPQEVREAREARPDARVLAPSDGRAEAAVDADPTDDAERSAAGAERLEPGRRGRVPTVRTDPPRTSRRRSRRSRGRHTPRR